MSDADTSLPEKVFRAIAWGLLILWAVLAVIASVWQAYKVVAGGGL